jgi:hypothetical protein
VNKRRVPRLAIGMVAVLAFTAAACSVEDVMTAPDCQTGGSILISAQSVPTADLVPCLNPLPPGWEIAQVQITQDGTKLHFNSDRAGQGAANLRFEDSCDIGGAAAVPSDQPGAERYELIESVDPDFRAQRFYVFPGGCVWWDFDFSADASASLSIELGDALTLITRLALREDISESFIDEDF